MQIGLEPEKDEAAHATGKEIGRQLASYDIDTKSERTEAERKAKVDVGEALGAHPNTVGAAYKNTAVWQKPQNSWKGGPV